MASSENDNGKEWLYIAVDIGLFYLVCRRPETMEQGIYYQRLFFMEHAVGWCLKNNRMGAMSNHRVSILSYTRW